MSDLHPRAAPRGLPVLAAVCLAALVLPLNFSAGAVATLAIGREVGGSASHLVWITNAFMLTFGSSLMAAGALADAFGRKKLFIAGIGAMALLSLGQCFAPSVLLIDMLRGLQGFAAAAALAGGSAALAQVFHGPALTRAFSALGTSFGVGLAFGPLVAGWLIAHHGWRSIFLGIALVGVVALLFGLRHMRDSRDPEAAGLDWPGALTFTAALASFTFAVVQAPSSGWGSALVLLLLAAFVVLVAAFVWIELRVQRPMLDLSLFRYGRFVGVQVLPIGTCYCFIVLLMMLPLKFIGIDGHSELDAGWMMLSLSAPMLVMPSIAAWLTRWIAAGPLAAFGLFVAAFGLYLLSGVSHGETGAALRIPLLVIGVGTGLPWGLMDALSITVVPRERAGMATGIFSTTRVAGEGIALAIVTALLAFMAQRGLAAAGMGHADIAGMQLASGNVRDAVAMLPGMSREALTVHYDAAFRVLLQVLAAITAVSAVITLACLAPRRASRTTGAAAEGTN
ncbi:MFS family permease [Luteibacter sp. Sphag1AF]|uniref:MFS transporter n=1 Tax=Luteibacter sp. Sphag1AF TaxID=2587031 RepID=UPI00161AFA69|nr:MFS transporter [Luteibacter sp. Sphag1AF]MBB3227833.1 MFS family permease [Luteibacter sp. Sphag1AF]